MRYPGTASEGGSSALASRLGLPTGLTVIVASGSVLASDAGLDWDEPPVEHYREGGEFFYFATPLELDDLGDLDWPETRNKVVRMLEGYLVAFGSAIVTDE